MSVRTRAHARAPAAHRLPAFLVGAWLVAVPAATADACWTVWSQPARPFGPALLSSALLGHLLLASAIALGLYPVLAGLVRWRALARPRRAGFATLAGFYLFVFPSFFHLVDLVGNQYGLGRLLSPRVALLELALLAASLTLTWCLAGGRRAGEPGPAGTPAGGAGRLLGLLLVGGLLWWGALELRPHRAHLVPAPDGAPRVGGTRLRNVLWIVLDTTRRDRMTVYDPDLETTPHLARFAEDAVVFDQASSAASFTLASHATMLSGRQPSVHGATHARPHFARENPSLAVELSKAGMRTAAFVSNHVLSSESGIHLGFEHYDDLVDPQICYTTLWGLVHNLQATLALWFPSLRNDGQPHWIEDHQRPAALQNERVLSWLEANSQEPFFLLVNYYDVHWPYLPEEPFRSRFEVPYEGPITGYAQRDDDFDPERGVDGFTEEDGRYLLSLYDGELAYLDHHVAVVLERLRALDQLDSTLVVITSDHGEYFGEHDMVGHSLLYEPVLAVPLILRLPGVLRAGQRVARPVQAADLAPTVLELAGLPVPEGMDGESLLPILEEADVLALPVIAEDNYAYGASVKMARLGSLKLLVGFGARAGEEELYDLARDPEEAHNLLEDEEALDDSQRRVLELLRGAIASLPVPGAPDGGAGATSRRMREALQALGYGG